ncbi:MAG: DUF6599 family protein [Chthonomonadales bacterium]
MRRCSQVGLILLGLGIICEAVRGQGNSAGLFPKTNEVAGWTLKEGPKFFNNDQLFDYMDGAAEIPKSYAFKQLGSAKYQKSTALTLEVAVFDMSKSADAFGYFSARVFLERSPRSKDREIPLDHPAHLYSSVGALTFWKDHYTVIIQPEIGRPDDATLIQFAKAVSAKIKAKGIPPTLLDRLPKEKQIVGTPRLVSGKATFDATVMFLPKDIFGLGDHPQIVGADYSLPGKSVTMFVAKYATPVRASKALNDYRAYLQTVKSAIAPGGSASRFVATSEKQHGTGAVVSGSQLGVIFGAKDSAVAEVGLKSLANKLSR